MSSTFRTLSSIGPFDKWRIALKILPFVVALVAAKVAVALLDADFIELSSLFGSVVAANVFLLGFLLAGTLSDFKEAEKLPTRIACCIEAIADDYLALVKQKNAPEARAALGNLARLTHQVHSWFYRDARTFAVYDSITAMDEDFMTLEDWIPPNYIVRLKEEQSEIRQHVGRIDTIRDTTFISAGYAIAEIATAILLIGSVFVDMGPWYEAGFYVSVVAFLLLYVIALTGDLDNPFDHGHPEGSVRVSLKPIKDVDEKITRWAIESGASPTNPEPTQATAVP